MNRGAALARIWRWIGGSSLAFIRVEKATKYYQAADGPVHALDNVDLEVQKGEFVCILGPSGCGKTTLLWAMSGLHSLTSGRITLDGTEVAGPRAEIGMVFQEANLLPWRNLLQNIHFPFEIKGIRPDKNKIDALLESVGLRGFERRFPRELSGGMQQRAALVRCLAQDPEVLLLDEPFGSLDPFTRDEMNLLLLHVWNQTRKTAILVTHSISEAIFLADRVVVLSPRPGRVAGYFDVDLPRPRHLEMTLSPEFVALSKEIRRSIDANFGRKGATRPAPGGAGDDHRTEERSETA